MEECKVLGIKQVFTSFNNPKGNAETERYFRTYKEEVVWPEGEMRLEELIRRAKEFEIFYNEEYPHSALGYKSPKEYYNEAAVYQKCV